jgi:putative Holliday junction resolvase
MGKILCLDYGRRRIGVSMSDPLKLTAQPVDTWVDLSEKDMVFKIQIIVKNEGVERIVVGYPLTLRGQKGSSARKVERFIGMLSGAVPVPVVPWDERLSSAHAHRIMHQTGKKPSRRKERVDVMASMLILQNYLDHVRLRADRQGEDPLEP